MNAANAGLHAVVSEGAEDHPRSVRAVVGRVRLLLERRRAWLAHLAETGAQSLILDGPEGREAERRFYLEESSLRVLNRGLKELEDELATDPSSRLESVAATVGLTPVERDVLHVCLAVAVEPSVLEAWARVKKGSRTEATVNEALIAELCGRPLPLLPPGSALFRWRIVRSSNDGAGAALSIDPYILQLICGRYLNDPAIEPHLARVDAWEPLAHWRVAEVAERVERANARGVRVRMVVRGPRGSGRSTFAASIARRCGGEALCIDTTLIGENEWSDVYLHAQRQAGLLQQFIVWRGPHAGRLPPHAPIAPVEFVTGDTDFELPRSPYAVDDSVSMPELSLDERRALWTKIVPESNAWPVGELDHVVERFRLQVGDIAMIGLRGVATAEQAREECRKVTRDRLGDLGQLINAPFRREDLTLSPGLNAILDQILFEANARARLWEKPELRQLFPRGRGLVALMAGPPGTGKTMAAQVIAAELGVDLFRIDLASTLNKYIGETAKNLRRIFARATEMNAVLLFDEADALFSKRTEVKDSHDRHANTDTNYLLQLLEDFEGIALLASNKRDNIDSAFTRRIRYMLSFRLPNVNERRQIWRRLIHQLEGEATEQRLGGQLDAAANAVELSGAQIKLSVLGAVISAQQARVPLSGRHLCNSMQRELEKVGLTLDPRERAKIEVLDRARREVSGS